MTEEEIQKALHRIAFEGGIDSNSSRDTIPVLLAKIQEEVVGWNTGVHETSAVELCSACKGRGTVERDQLTDYHKREYNTWNEACKRCGGSGRVRVTTKVRRQPFQPLMPDRLT